MKSNKRRDPLAGLEEEPVASLAHRPTQAKRNRAWERVHDDVVTFRAPGLKELNKQVKGLAHRRKITVGEAARIVLEAGLAALEG